MGVTPTSPPIRHALFKVLSVTPLSAHSHGFLPYSDLDPHLHIIIEVEIWTGRHWIKTFVMIDSGCSANVIDSRFAAALNIPPKLKSQAIKYTMADGKTSAGGTVTHDVTTKIKIGPHQESLTFDITKLHSYSIMLGVPWLKLHDPWIQWSRHRITFNSPFCLMNCKLNHAYTTTALSSYPTYTPPVTPEHTPSTTTTKSILKSIHPDAPRRPREPRTVSWSPDIPSLSPTTTNKSTPKNPQSATPRKSKNSPKAPPSLRHPRNAAIDA